jgi:alpha-methylacyl-CoA racemase
MTRTGPLGGITVVELGGIGPTPFACMLLADLGAQVTRVKRAGEAARRPPELEIADRGKRIVELDLQSPEGLAAAQRLLADADVVVEGFRPGVVERLGLGPEPMLAANPRLVFGRMTGWGQTGPRRDQAGHDINYLAISGALHGLGDADGPPQIPSNLLGDYGGGSLYLVVGVVSALVERARTGRGQVIDAAIVDGVTTLLASTLTLLNGGAWTDARGVNLVDGGAPFYGVYETADGLHVAVGALEPQFFELLLEMLGIGFPPVAQHDRTRWPELRRRLADAFRRGTRNEWTAYFAGTDACVTPVLSLREAAADPHLTSRGSLCTHAGRIEPGTAPRFARGSADEKEAMSTRDHGEMPDNDYATIAIGTVEEGMAWVGARSAPVTALAPVEVGQIVSLAAAVEDGNPTYWDADTAVREWGERIAPAALLGPLFSPARWRPAAESEATIAAKVPLPGTSLINIGAEAVFHRPLRVGDWLTRVEEVTSITPRSTRLGDGHVVHATSYYHDESGDLVAENTNEILRFTPREPSQEGRT